VHALPRMYQRPIRAAAAASTSAGPGAERMHPAGV
jgi:hypothetical protein